MKSGTKNDGRYNYMERRKKTMSEANNEEVRKVEVTER